VSAIFIPRSTVLSHLQQRDGRPKDLGLRRRTEFALQFSQRGIRLVVDLHRKNCLPSCVCSDRALLSLYAIKGIPMAQSHVL
jgi:hypothetical protein